MSPPWNSDQPPWRALGAPQIVGEAALHVLVDVVEEMFEQNALGGDGGVGFERKHEMAVGGLHG